VSRRASQVGDLLRREISDIIFRRVHDPRVRLVTVSSVDVSPDLRHAVVRLSILGSDDDRHVCLEAIRHARGFIRSELAHRLRKMRAVPELRFQLDKGAEYSQRIEELLERTDDSD
jgi:ribosome-binding factor A